MGRILGQFVGGSFTQEVPSGTINSVNTTFTLANTPNGASSFLLHLNGLLLSQTTDYTLSGTTITMTTAPDAGQTLLAFYLKQS